MVSSVQQDPLHGRLSTQPTAVLVYSSLLLKASETDAKHLIAAGPLSQTDDSVQTCLGNTHLDLVCLSAPSHQPDPPPHPPPGPSPTQPQSQKATEAQIEAITAKVAALQLEVNRRDAAMAKAQKKASAEREELKQLTAALLPLQQSLGLTIATHDITIGGAEPALPVSPTEAEPLSPPATPKSSTGGGGDPELPVSPIVARPLSPPATPKSGTGGGDAEQPVFTIESDNLGDALEKICLSSAPAVYDFQGRTMVYTGQGHPTICTSGATLRNGIFCLGEKQELVVDGKGVVLDHITVIGGRMGVEVFAGGCLTMLDCVVRDSSIGVYLNYGNSKADLTDCVIRGCKEYGIYAGCQGVMSASRLRITNIAGQVLRMEADAKVTLTACTLRDNPGKPGAVKGNASLVMTCCSVAEGGFDVGGDGGTAAVEIKR